MHPVEKRRTYSPGSAHLNAEFPVSAAPSASVWILDHAFLDERSRRSGTSDWDDEAANPFVSPGSHVRHGAVGDPHLPSVEDPVRSNRHARVRTPDGSEPTSGPVSPKHPIAVPAAIHGGHNRFCSSLSPSSDREHRKRPLV